MKLQMTRTLFYGHDTLEEGQVFEPENPEWWVDKGFAVPYVYETKPHPVVPMQAGGVVKPRQSSPPARQPRKRRPKGYEDSE
jgi:hypothetical protein